MDYFIVKTLNHCLGQYFALDVLIVVFSDFMIIALPFLVILIYLLKQKKVKPIILKIITGVFLVGFFNYIITVIFQRLRPFVLYKDIIQFTRFFPVSSPDFGFPSDHTAIAFVIAFVIWLDNKKIGRIFIILALLIGISRIFTGVHFLTDIIAGIIVAAFSSLLAKRILLFFKKSKA